MFKWNFFVGSKKQRRFLVIDILQLILVEPDSRKLGWGLVKFVGLLQDVEVTGDKEDSRSLFVTIHKPCSSAISRPRPLISAKFIFDDHIRCMAAKQRLIKGRAKARQRNDKCPMILILQSLFKPNLTRVRFDFSGKMRMIARLLELPQPVSSQFESTSDTPTRSPHSHSPHHALPGLTLV